MFSLGRPGVDSQVRHELEVAVLQIEFLLNEGALITATTDDSLHLWNFRQKRPEIVHSLKFQKERYECVAAAYVATYKYILYYLYSRIRLLLRVPYIIIIPIYVLGEKGPMRCPILLRRLRSRYIYLFVYSVV